MMTGRVLRPTVKAVRSAVRCLHRRGPVTGYALPPTVKTVSCPASRSIAVTRTPQASLLSTQCFVTPSSVFSSSFSNTLYTPFRRLRTKMEIGELSVATLDDYQQVMDLCSNVYGGLDYLPSTYPLLVEGPGVQGFLYKINGELAAFASSKLVDRDQTVLLLCARVKEALQGQGICDQLRDEFVKHFSNRESYPHLLQEKLVTPYEMSGKGYRLVLKVFRTDRVFEASSLSKFTLKASPGKVTTLQPEDVTQLFRADLTQRIHLFPQKQFLLADRPYAVMPENIPIIVCSGWNTQFYGTKAGNGGYTLLTAGSYHFCPLGVNYEVDIFGAVRSETVNIPLDVGKEHCDNSDMTGRKEENGVTTVAAVTHSAQMPMSDSKNKDDIFNTAGTLGDSISSLSSPHELELPDRIDKDLNSSKTSEKAIAGKEDRTAFRLSEYTETDMVGAKIKGKSDKPETAGRKKINKLISPAQKWQVLQGTPEHSVNFHKVTRPEAVKDHMITHLQRLQDMSDTLTGKVAFSIYASGVLEDVIADVTRELDAFKFIYFDDGRIIWEKDIKW